MVSFVGANYFYENFFENFFFIYLTSLKFVQVIFIWAVKFLMLNLQTFGVCERLCYDCFINIQLFCTERIII